MRQLYLTTNIKYLKRIGIKISKNIAKAAMNKKLPQLDDLIGFSNDSGISINDFLFEDIEQKNKLS